MSLAGFSQETRNASTACIAVLDGNVFAQNEIEAKVSLYRSFGGSVILVCRDDVLQFWHFSEGRPVCKEQKKINQLDRFFAKYKDKFSPSRISRAKMLGQFDKKSRQLSFHDFGLMSIVEKDEGEYLSGLIERMINELSRLANIEQESDQGAKWLTQAAFWLVGAKILKDKEVKNFKTLNLADIDSLSKRINRHYDANTPLDITNTKKRRALECVASEILKPVSSFSHLSINSLAYVYENTLITKATRKALGTHATPSWLVNYIVWQLVDWIENIPQKDRVIFEPTCGHAPFLTAGARILSFLYKGTESERHEYLKNHLIGIEKDPFAKEIARLALTLADIPNKDGWKLLDADIYNGDMLKDAAQGANILLCNPPFENFSPDDKQKYHDLKTGNKAAEVLDRTLRYMPDGSVFGVILQQGFLDKKNLTELRKYILDNFELRKICNLPDNVFAKAGHPSTVLLGRKVKSNKKISYLTISKTALEAFTDSYQAKEESFSKDFFYKAENCSLKVIELREIWDYCREYPKFQESAIIGRGIEYKDFDSSVKKNKFPGAVKGYASFEKTTGGANPKKVDLSITELPDLFWMSLKEDDIQNPRYGKQCGFPQIITSYLRTSRGVWRIKGLLELDGLPLSNKLISIRPISFEGKSLSLHSIWALVNSPFTNAYMFCHCRRQNLEGTLRRMPIPFEGKDLSRLESMTRNYLEFEQNGKFELREENTLAEKKRQCLLAIDAEILRLYDLPPRLEKQLLDFCAGHERKGVGFNFGKYFPEGFESWIPLHQYLSEEYQRSTPSFVKKWVEEVRSPELTKALEIAVEAFEED
ncbi:MAG: SAM-dependent DNA methyltransferase [Candidatus Omnitrophica bacterium]|nr:SAM-dependent DNA methyltransferase [Candidatus Omnitrophota bacterium]